MRKLLKKQGFAPDVLVTDKLRSYGAAKSEIGLSARHDQGSRKNNRAENSHQPTRRRERKMQRFKSPGSAQPSASCPFTPLSSTPSTSSAISHPATRSVSSETKRSGRGEPPPQPEPELGIPNLRAVKFGSRDSAGLAAFPLSGLHGRWKTATFLAVLRCDRVEAPFLSRAPSTARASSLMFSSSSVRRLGQGYRRGRQPLGSHKGKAVRDAVKSARARRLFPKYSPSKPSPS